jgi:hypothetical protein
MPSSNVQNAVSLHPRAESLGILNALRCLEIVCEAHIGIACEDDNPLSLRSWQAAHGIVSHSIRALCELAGVPL